MHELLRRRLQELLNIGKREFAIGLYFITGIAGTFSDPLKKVGLPIYSVERSSLVLL